ncbi:Alpha/Beta hydrolase protein [Bisporella sp. PMI_857]|nr:Alpha/Beta hydrolase protein [Bisporella sp. PMI_857]
MADASLDLWQRIALKITYYAIPTYVIPRTCFKYLFCRVRKERCPSQSDLIRNHVIRWLASSLDFRQFRLATREREDISSILDGYPELLQNGARVLELPDAGFTIFYIHGGGFTSGSSLGNARYLLRMVAELQRKGISCNILSVEYDLSPEAQYPTALRQISAAYACVSSKGKPIILSGDSAGAHLCMSLLKHLHTPNPKIQPCLEPKFPDLLVLVSPWVDLKNANPSVVRNSSFDCLDKRTLDRWAQQYLGPSQQLDEYTELLSEGTQWGDILPRSSFIIAGEFECFASDIISLAKNIEAVRKAHFTKVIMPQDKL